MAKAKSTALPERTISGKARRSGPNPGAFKRASIAQLPLGKLMAAALDGRFPAEVTSLGYAIAAVRQLRVRLEKVPPEEATKIRTLARWPEKEDERFPENIPEGALAYAVRDARAELVGALVERCIRQLGVWLAFASPADIKALAAFAAARPVETNPEADVLWLRPADPAPWAVARLLMEAMPKGSHKMTPEFQRRLGEMATRQQIDVVFSKLCPGLDKTTRRKVIAELLGTKRAPGRPESKSR